VVKADTPTVTATERNEQYCAPWIVESPGGTLTTSAYKDGKKRCLSAEGESGDPRKKVFEQNKTFMRAHRKSGRFLSEDEIRAEAVKRQKEMRGAARAAEMAVEEAALESLLRATCAVRASARIRFTQSANTFSTKTGHFLARPWMNSSFYCPSHHGHRGQPEPDVLLH
jgi:hypothetical protein